MRHNSIILGFIFIFLFFSISSFSKQKDVVAKPAKKVASEKKESKKTNDLKNKKNIISKDTSPIKKNYNENDFKPQSEEVSYAWSIIKVIIILIVMVGGFYYFLRFVTKKAGVEILGEDVINILSIVPVGQNKYLQVVEVGEKMLLIGVGDSNINLITEITDKDERDRIRLLSSKSAPVKTGNFQKQFSAYLNRFVENVSKNRPENKISKNYKNLESGVDLDYLRRQKNRLKKMNGDGSGDDKN